MKFRVQVERRATPAELPDGAPHDREVWKVDEYTIDAADEADVRRQLDDGQRRGLAHLQGVRIRSIHKFDDDGSTVH